MSRLLLLPLPDNEAMAAALAGALSADIGRFETRRFPDGESYLRVLSDVQGRDVAFVCTLDHPDAKLLPLLFAAATARELGARRVGLIAPYLAYMRQDQRFKPGEAVTSRIFASLVSEAFAWMVTVDPHLHRYPSLATVYAIPTQVAHAAPLISRWIRVNVINPVLVGPDSESGQWVSAVAADAGAPWTVLDKKRRGDREVEVSFVRTADLGGRTPVLLDDIISSGRTMLQAAKLLRGHTAAAPICVGVHGIFADRSDRLIIEAGARLVTCNTIPHPSNAIDVREAIAVAITEVIRTPM